MKKTSVSDYLIKCNLLDQVLDGINKAKIIECKKEAAVNELCEWTMGLITKSARVAGRCQHRYKRIQLHNELLKDGREKDRDDTLLHEIGHMLTHVFYGAVKIKAHGWEWKYITSLIGGSPTRCHNYEYFNDLRVATAKHKYTCKDCGYEIYTKRALKNIDRRWHTGCRNKPNRGMLTHEILR